MTLTTKSKLKPIRRGSLPAPPPSPALEHEGEEPGDPMVPYPLRLPRSLVERLHRMADRLAEDPELRIIARGRVTAGAVARLALTRGLDSLERRRPGETQAEWSDEPF